MKTTFNNLTNCQKNQAIKKIVEFNNGMNLPIFVTSTDCITKAISQGYNMDEHFNYEIFGKEINFSVKESVMTLEMEIEQIA